MQTSASERARITTLMSQLQGDLNRANETAINLQTELRRIGINEPSSPQKNDDPFAFITADAEREALRLTAMHPSRTAAEIAESVRARLPGYATTDKGVRYYWKMARKDPAKRALLPEDRQ